MSLLSHYDLHSLLCCGYGPSARRRHPQVIHDVSFPFQRSPEVLGQNNANLAKLAAICASIYRTDFSTTKIDGGIREFMQATGFDVISSIGANFDKKLQKGLERVHRDVVSAEK